MNKIAMLSPFSEFTKMLRTLYLDEEQDSLQVIEAYGPEALKAAHNMEQAGYDAIIARRFTAARLGENKLSIPVIDLRVNELDLLKEIHRTIAKGFQKIGCLFYCDELMDYVFCLPRLLWLILFMG